MEHVVRTVYGAYLQSCAMLGIAHSIAPYTTLNEKLGIQSGVTLPPGTYPKVQYYAIGNGGHSMTMGTDNIPLARIAQHKATDAALFNQLPFVLRLPGEDLSAGERAKYALRKEEVIAGTTYIAYYLRRISFEDVLAQMEYRNVENGVTTTSPFVPDATNLNPTPTILNPDGINEVTGDYITVTSQLPISFSAAEIADFLNVAVVKYGDPSYGIISEIGLCSGADKIVSVPSGTGSNFNFNEAIGVQIVSHVSAMHVAQYTSSGIEKVLDFGSNNPLFSIA